VVEEGSRFPEDSGNEVEAEHGYSDAYSEEGAQLNVGVDWANATHEVVDPCPALDLASDDPRSIGINPPGACSAKLELTSCLCGSNRAALGQHIGNDYVKKYSGTGTYKPIFFKMVLSSLISKGMLKSNMTSVRSRLISHWITAEA